MPGLRSETLQDRQMDSPLILVVDDAPDIRELVQGVLQRNHMKVLTAKSVAEAEDCLSRERVSLLLLDVMMPGEDGTSFCRRLRQDSDIPILMLSALGEELDRVVGLEMGADDYLAKPFNARELVARIKSLLRRAPPLKPGETHRVSTCYSFGPFQLYPETRSLQLGGEETALTSGEFAVLLALVEHAPRILNRDQLLDFTRGAAANSFDRSIDTQISRLRRKLKRELGQPDVIKTVRNVGYALAVPVTKQLN